MKKGKKLGIVVMRKFFEQNKKLMSWNSYFNKHSKRDDLADSFLQIIGYINNI